MPRPRPAALLFMVWLLGAVLATATGLLAVRLVGHQVGDAAVPTLSSGDVAGALTPLPSLSASPPPVRPVPSTPATRSAVPERLSAPATFTAPGGVVGAQCRGALPRLLYATPTQGYGVKDSDVEGGVLRVRFEGGDVKSRLEIGCRAGAPVLLRSTD